jgi:hypothetical protein
LLKSRLSSRDGRPNRAFVRCRCGKHLLNRFLIPTTPRELFIRRDAAGRLSDLSKAC